MNRELHVITLRNAIINIKVDVYPLSSVVSKYPTLSGINENSLLCGRELHVTFVSKNCRYSFILTSCKIRFAQLYLHQDPEYISLRTHQLSGPMSM